MLVGCLSFYNDVEFLPACLNYLSRVCDRIIAVDGCYKRLYEMWRKESSNILPWSTDGSLEILRTIPVDCDLTIIPHGLWESQVEKRNVFFKFLDEGDWFLIIDADELFIVKDRELLKSEIEESVSIAVSFVLFNVDHDCVTNLGYWHPRLFKYIDGMHYQATHWQLRDRWGKPIESNYPIWLSNSAVIAHLGPLKTGRRREIWKKYQEVMSKRGYLE